MEHNNGSFIISLDFELMWGVRDKKTISQYGNNIIGARKAIPELLNLFETYDISCTWAIVGLLFFDSKQNLLNNLPSSLPTYEDPNLSPFLGYLNELGENEVADNYHFGLSLIKLIQQYKNQEIATHTFSHFYCLEPGPNIASFESDLQAAISIAKINNISFKSIVFPRNQYSDLHIKVCKENGINVVRTNEDSWIYKTHDGSKESFLLRIFRFLDSYINISGHNCHKVEIINEIAKIPSSRFLRPFSKRLKLFNNLKLYRIKMSMTYAAKNNLVYHIWWHPHNFGFNLNENMAFLERILSHFKLLKEKYNFESNTMEQFANKLNN